MKIASFHSSHCDPYIAGKEIALNNKALSPKIIFIFIAATYKSYQAILDGMEDHYEGELPLIIGCTSDGNYLRDHYHTSGVVSMGIKTEDSTLQFHSEIMEDTLHKESECAKTMSQKILEKLPEAKLALVFATSNNNGSAITRGLNQVLSCPAFGGLAGDNRHFVQDFIIYNKKVYTQAIVLVGLSGQFRFKIEKTLDWRSLSHSYKVTKSSGRFLEEIDNIPALAFFSRELERELTSVDFGITALKVQEKENDMGFYYRTIAKIHSDQRIECFGDIPVGSFVSLCDMQIENISEGAKENATNQNGLPFHPEGGLLISCAGRKWIMGLKPDYELKHFFSHYKQSIPFAGFPSHGEIAPLNTKDSNYRRNDFHNVTLISLIIGIDKNE